MLNLKDNGVKFNWVFFSPIMGSFLKPCALGFSIAYGLTKSLEMSLKTFSLPALLISPPSTWSHYHSVTSSHSVETVPSASLIPFHSIHPFPRHFPLQLWEISYLFLHHIPLLHPGPPTTLPCQTEIHVHLSKPGLLHSVFPRCGFLYIGEANLRPGDCFAKHLCPVHQGLLDLPVSNQFNFLFLFPYQSFCPGPTPLPE